MFKAINPVDYIVGGRNVGSIVINIVGMTFKAGKFIYDISLLKLKSSIRLHLSYLPPLFVLIGFIC